MSYSQNTASGTKLTATPRYRIPIYRISLVRESSVNAPITKITQSTHAVDIVRAYLAPDTDREHFVVLLLDGKHQVIGINTVSTGSLTASIVHQRELFKPAILTNCAAVIMAHNHPSGDPTPSPEDSALTKRTVESGALLGIPVLDHVIIGDGTDRYFSFADHGMLS